MHRLARIVVLNLGEGLEVGGIHDLLEHLAGVVEGKAEVAKGTVLQIVSPCLSCLFSF
jgi:hypothetical protein